MAKFVLAELSEKHELVKMMTETLQNATKQAVAFISVDKMVKKLGVATKQINFNFEEGQSLSFVLRTDGDVIKHSLNNKNIPLLKVMDYDKLPEFKAGLEDLALKLKSNQEKFNIKRQSARVIIPRDKVPSPTVKKRIATARETLKELGEQITQKQASLQQKRQELETLKAVQA